MRGTKNRTGHHISPDPEAWDFVEELRRKTSGKSPTHSDVYELGVKLLRHPDYLATIQVQMEQEAAAVNKVRQMSLQEMTERELMEKGEELFRDFLQVNGRTFGKDYWRRDSPHFDAFQRKMNEWASTPEVAIQLRERGIPVELVEPLLIRRAAR